MSECGVPSGGPGGPLVPLHPGLEGHEPVVGEEGDEPHQHEAAAAQAVGPVGAVLLVDLRHEDRAEDPGEAPGCRQYSHPQSLWSGTDNFAATLNIKHLIVDNNNFKLTF